ncbi:hypothetical protein Amal_02854 [Acetobacter malorum]|uniref:Uncharacterized protein n=1 Tax=Acetobacter malorum TaxID=178901 RepID=A0A177GB79_9PROT|nr:hypothetical protein Amal_02854 [Acetobacter malorum]
MRCNFAYVPITDHKIAFPLFRTVAGQGVTLFDSKEGGVEVFTLTAIKPSFLRYFERFKHVRKPPKCLLKLSIFNTYENCFVATKASVMTG